MMNKSGQGGIADTLTNHNAYFGRSETFCRGFQTSIYRKDRNEQKMLFSFHCAHLALSLNKIGGGSAMKIKKCFFSFHCARLALSLHIN